jgi:hypothetical protein
MKPLRRRIARLAVALGVVALTWACNAPFIPVPPPGQSAAFTSALVSDGAGAQKTVWTAHGGPFASAASARFFIFDTERNAGVIAKALADGSYTSPPMDGAQGDHVQISYETTDGDLSASFCVLLMEGPTAPLCP